MSINLKEIQKEKVEEVINILKRFKEDEKNKEGINIIDEAFNLFSFENVKTIIERVGANILIKFMTIYSDKFSPETACFVLKYKYLDEVSDKMKLDFIDCHLSNLKRYGSDEDIENHLEEQKKLIMSKISTFEKDDLSLIESFKSNIRISVYNIGVILQEATPIYERNVDIKLFINKFKDFFEEEKKEILSNDSNLRLSYYGEEFSTDMILQFVEKLQVSEDQDIQNLLKYLINSAISGKNQDNLNYVIYLFSESLKKSKENVKKELLNLFEVENIFSVIVNNEEILKDFNKDNLEILKYYTENFEKEECFTDIINKMKITDRKNDNGITREAFGFIIKNEKLLKVFVKYGFDKLYESFVKSLEEYSSYNFSYIELKENEDIDILMLMKDDNIYRNISLMYNYYTVFKHINSDINSENKLSKWLEVFNDNRNIYLNMFSDKFSEFAIKLMIICEQDKLINLKNIQEDDYKIIKEVALKITQEDFTIESKNVKDIVEKTLKNDWNLFLAEDDGRMYFEILNKLKFLNKKTIDVLHDKNLSEDIKNLFISKQIVLSLNNSDNYVLDLEFNEEVYSPTFSNRVVSSIINSESWGEEGYRNLYSLKKNIPINMKIEIKEFFDMCYLVDKNRDYKRRDIKESIINIFQSFVDFNISKKEFFEKYKEYDNPLFNKIISKYLK